MKLKVSKGWLIFSAIVMAIALVVYFFGFEKVLIGLGITWVIFMFILELGDEPIKNLFRFFLFVVFFVGLVTIFSPSTPISY